MLGEKMTSHVILRVIMYAWVDMWLDSGRRSVGGWLFAVGPTYGTITVPGTLLVQQVKTWYSLHTPSTMSTN